jgi:hypothetical protein
MMKVYIVVVVFILGIFSNISAGDVMNKEVVLNSIENHFIKNEGQIKDRDVLFSSFPVNLFLLRDRIYVNGAWIVFHEINKNVMVIPEDEKEARFSYFNGDDPEKWRKGVPSYGRVRYRDIYPGVDLVFTGIRNGKVEFQWFITPGADPGEIKFEIEGENVEFEKNKNGIIVKREGEVLFGIENIKAYQGADEIFVSLRIEGGLLSYDVGLYDKNEVLVIDPDLDQLLASTYLGGSDHDWGFSVILDDSGNVFVTGMASSPDFPIIGGYDPTFNGGYYDVFIAKLNSSLNSLLASTFLGGNDNDWGFSIILDDSGNVFVTGTTKSSDFPIVDGYDPTFNDSSDVFIAKLNSSLNSLLASTFLGGNDWDGGRSIILDDSGNVFVTGHTQSSDFPIVDGYDPTFNDSSDVFIAKLNSSLNSLLASTFLGGNDRDVSFSIILDGSGNAFVTGFTWSSDFPVVGGYDPTLDGDNDAFVAKLTSNLNSLLASTFLGGNDWDGGRSIILDDSGNVFVTGHTQSSDFPIVDGYDPTFNGNTDVFIAKFNYTVSISEKEQVRELKNRIFIFGDELLLQIESPSYLGINVYSVDGRLCRKISYGYASRGLHLIKIRGLPSGVYFLKIRIGDQIEEKKFICF